MADFIHKNTRGNQSTVPATQTVAAPTPEDINNLFGVDVKTNVVDQSIKVVSGATVLAIIHIPSITNWSLAGNVLTVLGETSVVLNFSNTSEAQSGESRFSQIIDGAILA